MTDMMTTPACLPASPLETLLEKQRQLESHGVEWGRDIFRNRVEKATRNGEATVVGGARKVLQQDLEKLILAIDERMVSYTGKRGVKPVEFHLWKAMDAGLQGLRQVYEQRGDKQAAGELPSASAAMAYVTAKSILDLMAEKMSRSKVARTVADRIIDQAKAYRFQAKAPALFDYMQAGFKTTHYGHMKKVMDSTISGLKDLDTKQPIRLDLRIDVDEPGMGDLDDMNDAQRVTMGINLLNLFIESTGAVDVADLTHTSSSRGRKSFRTEACVVPTLKTEQWIRARNAAAEGLCPVALPMVVPPLPWAPGLRGGYRFALYGTHPFIRSAWDKALYASLAAREMPIIYRAVNALQETAWKINPHVAALLDEVRALGGGLAGVPQLEPVPLPMKPADISTNEEARKAYRKAAKKVHERNLARRLKAGDFLRTMSAAGKVRGEDAIYFVYNVDFRGRIYPVASYLHPQGDDLSKSLLQFATGKPLGPEGVRALALHGMNCLDVTPDGQKVSTMTLDERVQWVSANSDALVAVAKAPMGNRWWAEAGEPLSFYAFCCEWAGYCEQGESYISSLPVCVDGTCNGLQHFGGMFNDEVGGEAVNLMPQRRPRDVYRQVAEAVLATLEERASSDAMAALWLSSGLVTRRLCKGPTMTFAYGSVAFGFSKRLVEYVKGLPGYKETIRPLFNETREDGQVREGGLLKPASAYLGTLIYHKLRDIVTKAVEGMDWMRKSARQVAKGGRRVQWEVPLTGFPVTQYYMVRRKQQIRTALLGGICRSVVQVPTAEVAQAKQATAVAPNLVHSFDAACLQLTVNAALDAGVTHFQMIHDSYGTHAADMPKLARALREQFVRFYETGVVENIAGQFAQQAPEDATIPATPAMGTLDLRGVEQSAYFFC